MGRIDNDVDDNLGGGIRPLSPGGGRDNFYRPRVMPVQTARPPGPHISSGQGGQGILGSLTGGLGGGIEKGLGGLEKGLGGILSKVTKLDLEMEDIILLLILFLMYRESKDEQLLVIMGIMLFL